MDPLAPLIDALHAQGRLRVWSLVITVFGDLVQHRGGEISTVRLGQVLGRIGVTQGALRTALSRLNRDGWVSSAREGRTSLYRLSAQGQDRFAPATTRIYAAPRTGRVTDWALGLSLTDAGVPVIALTPAGETEGVADCRVVGRLDALSAAYRAALLGSAHRSALEALAADLAALATPMRSPLESAAARVLLIHRWRRIVLRYPDLPAELMPLDSPLADPRRAVAEAYARIAPDAEAWLDSAEDSGPAMPIPRKPLFARFGGPDRG